MSAAMDELKKRYDVVVYEIESGVVESIVGKDMRLSDGHRNAIRRRDTLLERVNDRYSVRIVAAGSVKVGEVL